MPLKEIVKGLMKIGNYNPKLMEKVSFIYSGRKLNKTASVSMCKR